MLVLTITLAILLATAAHAADSVPTASHPGRGPWNIEQLSIAPKAHPAEGFSEPGLHAVFLEGLPWRGRPTRFFAWYGIPKPDPGQKLPAMVLVHGGGGTAQARWVRQWNQRGYAAIAIDTDGNVPPPVPGDDPVRHPAGGPKGSDHCFTQLGEPVEDQWAYHAVANIMLAHSFLREMPHVDPQRIGITGVSWGGYLTSLVVGVDPRFRFAVPVYGCGYLAEDSAWTKRFEEMDEAKRAQWLELWDPARYLPAAKMPILWINGDMDGAFSLKIMRMSFLLPQGDRYLSIQPNMPHSHESGEVPPEIAVFAEQVLNGGRPLARCKAQGHDGNNAWAHFVDVGGVKQVRCAYTLDSGRWMGRQWTPADATWDPNSQRAEFMLPDGVTAFYFVVTDDRGLMSSSEPVEFNP